MRDKNNKTNSGDGSITCRALAAAVEAAYHWDIASDALKWSENVSEVLPRDASLMATGRRYSSMLDPDNLTSRYDVVMNSAQESHPEGVRFRIEYQLKPTLESPAIWVEDCGRWLAGPDGRPKEVYGVVRRIDERHQRDQEQSYLSRTDALTGLMNRGRMMDALEQALISAQRSNSQCAFAIATIQNLNVINEAYGFEIADEVIAAVAQRLRKVMRSGDGIARYSNSKFGIILNQCAPAELSRALERFLLVVRDSVIETSRGPVWAMLSIGAVSFPDQAVTVDETVTRATEALNASLRMASDGFEMFTISQERDTQRMLNSRLATEIVDCLKSGVFHLAFQPVVDAKSRAVVLHEALLRMKDSAGEFVAAGHLIPVAERLGLVRLIDRAVLQLALETLHRYPKARLSINISATTANDKRWSAQLSEMIAAAQPINERLTVEITETTALSDLTVALAFFASMRAAGCCVAIDDFGSGFTSFRNLRDLPVDIIKLDGSYCRNLADSEDNRYFAKTLIDMAHRYGIKSVAEWVETEADAKLLQDIGIDYIQGHFIGSPSVVPPWSDERDVAFNFVAEPQPPQPLMAVDIEHLETAAAPGVSSSLLEVELETVASVAAVEGGLEPETEPAEVDQSAPVLGNVSKAPIETALAVSPTIDLDSAPDAIADNPVDEATDNSLSKLREALELLNTHFRSVPSPDRQDRLAS